MQCPECQGNLKLDAAKCACGWVKPLPGQAATKPSKPSCGTCENDATTKAKIDGQWINQCEACTTARLTASAKEYCKSIGLNTIADCKAWSAKNALLLKKIMPAQREPGEEG